MTSDQVRAICVERLGGWTDRLVEHHATPVLLIAVGHDAQSGQLRICIPVDIPDHALRQFIEFAHQEICVRGRRPSRG